MKRSRQFVVAAFLAAGMMFAPAFEAMGAEQAHRGAQTSASRGSSSTSRGSSNNHRGSGAGSTTNSGAASRPGGNQGNSQSRPGGNQGNSQSRPGGNQGNSQNRPGGNQGNSQNRPGGNQGSSQNRPGGNMQPGNHGSAPRPGTGSGYHPVQPRPNHAPRPVYGERRGRPLPPPPPRYHSVRVGTPSISAILGLTFGSMINYGIDQLLLDGYSVIGTYDNAIYLSNVNRFGVIWPEVTMYYGNTGLSGARFQYNSYRPSNSTYRSAYRQLCNMYGRPVSVTTSQGVTTATWWGGNNTGYITLQYGPGTNQFGNTLYYTDLIYGTY